MANRTDDAAPWRSATPIQTARVEECAATVLECILFVHNAREEIEERKLMPFRAASKYVRRKIAQIEDETNVGVIKTENI